MPLPCGETVSRIQHTGTPKDTSAGYPVRLRRQSGNLATWQSGVSSWRREEADRMPSNLESALFVFVLATFVGFEVIRRVSPLLHTPLMSLTNAISAISLVGSIVITGAEKSTLSTVLGTIAVVCATANVVGGFVITDRMLKMFKKRETGR